MRLSARDWRSFEEKLKAEHPDWDIDKLAEELVARAEKEAKPKKLGSKEEPLKWKNPNFNSSSVYRDEKGTWWYKSNAKNEWFEADKLPPEWHDKLLADMATKQVESANEYSEEEQIGIVSTEKKSLEGSGLKKFLNAPENKTTILNAYKGGYSTGSIAKSLGLPQDKSSRAAIRALLRKAGIYKELNKAVQKEISHKAGFEGIQSDLGKLADQYAKGLSPGKYAFEPSNQAKAQQVFKQFMTQAKIQNADSALSATVGHWVGSSHSVGAQTLKAIAAEYYGKDIEIEPKLSTPVSELKLKASSYKSAMLATKEFTKAWVTRYGSSHVYRGLRGAVANEIKKQLQSGASEIELTANTLSSWSESQSKAESSFGSGGVVLKMKVDPEHVWACYGSLPFSGFNHYKTEKEYVMGIPGQTFKIKKEDIEIQ